ncbi:MAG TPA: hypothetical protein VKU01_34550 [Bryobacteraceae bacterium]|nr:hypothetical protein [Bryobacteraceae bacterium]
MNLPSGILRQMVLVAVLPVLSVVSFAQSPTPPFALFERSALTGSGNTVTATQVPVVIAPGVTIYVNLTMKFNVDSNGNLTLAAGFPQVVPAPTLIASGFRAGNYAGPSNILSGKALVTVAGPGVTDGGATVWTLTSAAGADICTFPGTATWYVGPMANNPLAARISRVGLTSTAYSYGTASSRCNSDNGAWVQNTLIGVSQVGNTITFVSFTSFGTDSSTPQDQITFTLTQ